MHTLRLSLFFGLSTIVLGGCTIKPHLIYGSNLSDREVAYFDRSSSTLIVSCNYDARPMIRPDKNLDGATLYCSSNKVVRRLWHVVFAMPQSATLATVSLNANGRLVSQMHIAGGLSFSE